MGEIYGPITGEGISGSRMNYKLRQLYKTGHLVADIKRKLLQRQLKHVIRMEQSEVTKRSFESSSEGKMKIGKSRLR
jgi:hypothetical protein